MEVISLTLGQLSTNCYIIPTQMNRAIVIDPACDAEVITSTLNQHGLNLSLIILTHGHFDHFMAVNELVRNKAVPVYVHKDDDKCLSNMQYSLYSAFSNGTSFIPAKSTNFMYDTDKIRLDNVELIAIHTPGHSEGSVCLFSRPDKIMFCGDTIFKGSIGNTDHPYGNFKQIMDSLERIKKLNTDFTLYPGHGPITKFSYELSHNIYFTGLQDI